MIGFLSGEVLENTDGKLLLIVGGVGYSVAVPLSAEYGLLAPGKALSLYCHTHVREDALDLYGFATRDERDLFLILLGANGIGPKMALGILSRVQPAQLVQAVMNDDSANDLSRSRPYHHGDLRNGLLEAARTILEEEDLSNLTLRAVARKAGVSHAAPYRHFPNHEALLVELSLEGFRELREMVAEAARMPGPESDRTANIGAAYMRFVARRPAVARLMFGGQLPNREKFPALGEAADAVGTEIGNALPDAALGMAVWSAMRQRER